MEKIDRKFRILAVNPCNGKVYTDENAMLFVAKDAALPNTLRAYYAECEKLGCDSTHLESVALLLDRVEDYQRDRSSEVRMADTTGVCEVARCIGGIFNEEVE